MSTEPAAPVALSPARAPGQLASPRRLALNGPTMGSRWTAAAWADHAPDPDRLAARLQAAVDQVNAEMSTWQADSDLQLLNATPVGDWRAIPKGLMTVLAAGLAIGRQSEGAFNIGVGALVAACGFGSGRRSPDGDRLAELLGRLPLEPPRTLELDPAGGRARRLAPVTLDLSGIAKGFGVDELARVMQEAGISSFLVGIDGEMRAEGVKPDGRPWAVAHEKPVPGERAILGVLTLSGASVATSGSYRHQAKIDGRLVSHTMDPATGRPLENSLVSVTVLAATCMEADAWATALMVAGADKGVALARRRRLAALFVEADGTVTDTLS
ncbi:FAD:protein FMN transferase [Segnochrobactraceae bacterium EtOH-i3]